MKELKQMVSQADAKKMGFAEYQVYQKLRKTLRKRGPKSDQVFKKCKNLVKNGHSDSSDHREKRSGHGSGGGWQGDSQQHRQNN